MEWSESSDAPPFSEWASPMGQMEMDGVCSAVVHACCCRELLMTATNGLAVSCNNAELGGENGPDERGRTGMA